MEGIRKVLKALMVLVTTGVALALVYLGWHLSAASQSTAALVICLLVIGACVATWLWRP